MPTYRWSSCARAFSTFTLLSLVLACGGGDDTPSQPANPTLSLALNPATAVVVQGSSTAVTATATGGGSFSGTASITPEGWPAGITGAVTNVQTSGQSTTATIDALTATTVATGAYPLTVRATGSGVTSDATLTLSVTNPVAGTWTFTNADLTEDGITNLQITFDGNLDAERVQITLNGTAVDLPVSLITGGASVDGSTVTIDVGLLGNDEIDFEGELDEARSSATGTMSYIIVGPDGARHDGGGAASITKGS